MTASSLLNDLFRYKASADNDLLEAMASRGPEAPSAEYAAACRILTHIRIVDRIFAAHLQANQHGFAESWTEAPPPLGELAAEIRETDHWYVGYTARITDDALEEEIDFTFTDGQSGRMSRAEMLAHVVTHAGYHRGEIGRLLPEVGHVGPRDVFAGYLHRSDLSRRRPTEVAIA